MRIDEATNYTPARIEAERKKLALLKAHTGTIHLADTGRPNVTFCGQRRENLSEVASPDAWPGMNSRCQRRVISWNARLEAAGMPTE